MKKLRVIVLAIVILSNSVYSQSGADCSNAIPLTMDGVIRTYPTSSSTGSSIICTAYTGTAPITFFSFNTNAATDKVLIEITAPTAAPCEVLLYSSDCAVLYSSGSMCYDDGTGLWSFSHAFVMGASTPYKLRIRTSTTGNISISAKYYMPANNTCAGGFGIGPVPIADNNACHIGGTGLTPGDLCASTLENTAFYRYAVETDGISIININNINCDNGATNNSNGFQIGFFTGSCLTLTPVNCFSGSGSFVTASTASMPAGTEVFVAIDGVAGSNCRYEISVINGIVLAATINEFIGWKESKWNRLKWSTFNEDGKDDYEIQRSVDRNTFATIGRVNSIFSANGNAEYMFDDKEPATVSYYRLRYIDRSGKSTFSKVIEIRRVNHGGLKVDLINPAVGNLNMRLTSDNAVNLGLTIFNQIGQPVINGKMNCNKGLNVYSRSIANLPAGNYYVVLSGEQIHSVIPFIKIN